MNEITKQQALAILTSTKTTRSEKDEAGNFLRTNCGFGRALIYRIEDEARRNWDLNLAMCEQ
jgi:hypothetical protein